MGRHERSVPFSAAPSHLRADFSCSLGACSVRPLSRRRSDRPEGPPARGLHHMESPQAQDELFVRLHALLRPGAALLGVDSIDSEMIRQGHRDDTYVPVAPDTLEDRLHAAGFADITVNRPNQHQFRFTARRPTPPS